MDTKRIQRNRGSKQGEAIRIESSSKPGLFHYIDLGRGLCSCPATVKVCRHLRIAAVRAAKGEEANYYVERKHNSRISDFEYLIVRKINGHEEVLGFRPTRKMAEADVAEIVSGLEIA